VHFDRKGLLVGGSVDNLVKIWDVASGKCLDTKITLEMFTAFILMVRDYWPVGQWIKLSEFGNSEKSNQKLDTAWLR
jgi:hypothetical protein